MGILLSLWSPSVLVEEEEDRREGGDKVCLAFSPPPPLLFQKLFSARAGVSLIARALSLSLSLSPFLSLSLSLSLSLLGGLIFFFAPSATDSSIGNGR